MSTTSANLGDSRLEPRLPRRPVEQTGLVEDDAAVAAEEGGIRQLDLVARAPDLEDGAHAEVAQLPLDVQSAPQKFSSEREKERQRPPALQWSFLVHDAQTAPLPLQLPLLGWQKFPPAAALHSEAMGHSVLPGLQLLVQYLPPSMATHFMLDGQLPSWAHWEHMRRGRQ